MTKAEAIAKLKILLGVVAASSAQRGESEAEFVATLEAMRDAIDESIERCTKAT